MYSNFTLCFLRQQQLKGEGKSDSSESHHHDDDTLVNLVESVLQTTYNNSGRHSKNSTPAKLLDEDKEAFRKFLEEVDSEDDFSMIRSIEDDAEENYERNLASQLGVLDSTDSEDNDIIANTKSRN